MSLIRQLWEPFVTDVDETMFEFAITESDRGFRLLLPDLEPLDLTDPWAGINAIKYSVVDHALQRADTILALHAALVAKDGARVLIVGGSGSGKTTLCLELLERGWRYGSDDLAPLVVDDGGVLVFPRAIALRDPQVWDRYLERWEPPAWLPFPTGPFQLPSSLFEAMGRAQVDPTHLFFLDPDHTSPPASKKLSRAFVTAQLSQYVRWFGLHDVGPLAKLGRSVEGWALAYRTPAEGADEVVRACFEGGTPSESETGPP